MFYYFAKLVFSLAIRLGFFELTVTGKEKIPVDGAVILAANHYGPFDPLFIIMLTRRPVRFMARSVSRQYDFWRRRALAFMVEKGNLVADRTSLSRALHLLGRRLVVGMMVIGHWQKNDPDARPQRGACYLAFTSDLEVAIVPIGVYWTTSRGRTHVCLACGDPLRRAGFADSRAMNEALHFALHVQRHRAEELAL